MNERDEILVEEHDEVVEESVISEGFGAKLKRGWKNFVNDPVKGGKKIALCVACILGGVAYERSCNHKVNAALKREIVLDEVDTNGNRTGNAVRTNGKEVLMNNGKTHCIHIERYRNVEKLNKK